MYFIIDETKGVTMKEKERQKKGGSMRKVWRKGSTTEGGEVLVRERE